jgi:hypothetical protein
MNGVDPSQNHPETTDTPQVLLEHHLKAFRLPTIPRRWCWSWHDVSLSAAARTYCCWVTPGRVRHISRWPSACQHGHRVRFTTAAALVNELIEARDDRKLLRFQKQIASYELLIVDELGFVPLSKIGAELLFEMLSQRYERGSTLVTSNLPFAEWTEVLGSERLTGALLDRLTHHVHILEMNGDSFRLKQSKRKRGTTNP